MNKPWIHIIGAGVSGLSLARCLARAERLPGDIVISDPHLDAPQSQTFCFWFDKRSERALQPERRWSEWSFSSLERGREIKHKGRRYAYGAVSGAGFRARCLEVLNAHPQVHFNSNYIAQTPDAEHVFDSRPPQLSDFRVNQSFMGLEVELDQPHQLNHVQLMHDLTYVDHGVQFRYVLPLSETRLLVEYTRFTTQITSFSLLEDANRQWLDRSVSRSYEVVRTEQAHIPMGISGDLAHFGVPIGARAGMTRDATGYGFVNIGRWAERTSSALLSRNQSSPYQTARLKSWMDNHLLKIIEQRPDVLPQLLMHLSASMSADAFAGFMTRCGPYDALRTILAAPKRPFLFSALNRLQRV